MSSREKSSPGDGENLQPVDWEFSTPPPEGIAECQSAILNGKLFIGGRFTSSSDQAKLLVLALHRDGGWSVLPTPTSRCGITTYKQELVLVGGKASGQHTNKLWNSKDEGKTWSEDLPPMPTDRDSATAVNIGRPECILVAGGERVGGLSKTVEVLVRGCWWTVEPLEVKTSCLKPAVWEDTLYLIGGYRQTNSVYFSKVDTILVAYSGEDEKQMEMEGESSERDVNRNLCQEGTASDEVKLHKQIILDKELGSPSGSLQWKAGNVECGMEGRMSQGSGNKVTRTSSRPVWSKSFAPLRNSCCASDGKRMITCGKAYFSHEPPKIHYFSAATMAWRHLWFLPDDLNSISLAVFLPTGELMAMDSDKKIVKGLVRNEAVVCACISETLYHML